MMIYRLFSCHFKHKKSNKLDLEALLQGHEPILRKEI
jgi:hypothetical protein